MEQNVIVPIIVQDNNELSDADQALLEHAREAALKAYAPYSEFRVGAAVRLENDVIITGSNQENAAYPSGICAERTAIFYANAQYPDVPIVKLAIIAIYKGETTPSISPCGSCRQVILESITRYDRSFPVILGGRSQSTIVPDGRSLLPLTFDASAL